MANLTSRLTVSLKDDVSGPAKGAASSLKAVGASAKDLERLGKIDAFRGLQKSFADARATFNATQASVRKVAQEIAAADAPTRKMEASYRAAQRAAKGAAEAFRQQSTAIKASFASLNGAGIPLNKLVAEENRLRAAIERTTAAAARRNAMPRDKLLDKTTRGAGGVLAAGAAAVTGYKAKEFGKKAVVSAAEFDIGVRKQREFVDVPKDVQDSTLIPQAKKIGQDTQFSNLDVVKAQTKAMQGLPADFGAKLKAEVGAGIVESVKNYALVMEADLERSSEAIRTFLQTTNKDISTKEKALAEATRSTNLMVKMAKLGGMNDEDVQQFMKFGAATGTAAGLSDTSLAALGSVGRRGGLRGDELGVFVRAISSKLVAPTGKGLDALSSAGIDFNKFTTMPGGLSVANLEGLSKRRFGKGFNGDQVDRLDSILDNPEVVSDRDEFTKQVSEIVAESFDKKKNGKTKAQDAQKIAKMVGDFHKLSTESVDTEGLLNAIMTNPKMSIALLNAMFTDKHGGKGSILASKWGDFRKDKEQLDGVAGDPDFAKRKADEIMGGLGGAFERLKGSVENLTLAVGQAHERWLKVAMDKAGNAMDVVSNLKKDELAAASTVAAGGGAMAALALVRKIPWVQSVIGAGSGTASALGGVALAGYAAYSLAEGANERAGITRDSTRERQRKQAAKYNKWGMYKGESDDGSVWAKGAEDWSRLQPSAPQGASGSEDIWSKGTEGVSHLNQAGAAAAAAKATVDAYMAAAASALAAVDPIFAAAVQRWNGILGGVKSSPTITPNIGAAPSGGSGGSKGASLEHIKSSQHAALADYGFGNLG